MSPLPFAVLYVEMDSLLPMRSEMMGVLTARGEEMTDWVFSKAGPALQALLIPALTQIWMGSEPSTLKTVTMVTVSTQVMVDTIMEQSRPTGPDQTTYLEKVYELGSEVTQNETQFLKNVMTETTLTVMADHRTAKLKVDISVWEETQSTETNAPFNQLPRLRVSAKITK